MRKPLLAVSAVTVISPWTLLAATATANPCPAGTPPALCGYGPTMTVAPRPVPAQPPLWRAPVVVPTQVAPPPPHTALPTPAYTPAPSVPAHTTPVYTPAPSAPARTPATAAPSAPIPATAAPSATIPHTTAPSAPIPATTPLPTPAAPPSTVPVHTEAPSSLPVSPVPAATPTAPSASPPAVPHSPLPTEPAGSPPPSHQQLQPGTPAVPSPSAIPRQVTTAPHAGPTVGPQTPHPTVVGGQTTIVTPSVSPMPKPLAPVQAIAAPKVAAARNAPAIFASPVSPPQPVGPKVEFASQVNQVVNSNARRVDVINVNNVPIVRPARFDFVDYDPYRRPFLFNPLDTGLTFRYFYDNAFREAFVAPGARLVLDAAIAGVYPFTVVGLDYLASGLFNGGAWIPPVDWVGPPPVDWVPPELPPVWNNIYAYVPALDQTVAVDRVTLVGHDESKPVGSQDTMMLNGSTLAWGQINDARDGGQISVAKTQPTPGVGPVDDGQSIVLTSASTPAQANGRDNTTMWLLGGILGIVAVTGATVLWIVRHPKGRGPDAGSTPTTLLST